MQGMCNIRYSAEEVYNERGYFYGEGEAHWNSITRDEILMDRTDGGILRQQRLGIN